MPQNELLNQVAIVIARSLLQYTTQAWPWTSNSSHLREPLDELVAAQSRRIEQLCELLDRSRWTIDLGSFPDFTDLHFLSLDFLLPHLVENERGVIREIESALAQCTDDAEASTLLTEILAGERAALNKLEELSRTRPVPAGA